MSLSNIKKYYGKKGSYLEDHKEYFTQELLDTEIAFIVSALKLKKSDKVLDLACGNGRHTVALVKRGYKADGLDFSDHLIDISKKDARVAGVNASFYVKDINDFNYKKKYDKIMLFFAEFGLFNPDKVLNNVYNSLVDNGLFLLDFDNLFRLLNYLLTKKQDKYFFNALTMRLNERGNKGDGVRYYAFTEIQSLFEKHNFKIINTFGNYQKSPFTMESKRTIIVAQKLQKRS